MATRFFLLATALFNKYKKIGMPNLRLASSDVADLLSFLETHGNGAPGKKARKEAGDHH